MKKVESASVTSGDTCEKGTGLWPTRGAIETVLVVSSVLVLIVVLLIARAQGHRPLRITDLDSPRGLTPLADGGLLIAEVLGGRVLRVDPSGELWVLQEGLPATMGGPGERYPTGVSAALLVDETLYFVVGEFRGRGYSTLYKVESGGSPQAVAGGVGRDGFPMTHLTNPYDLVPAPGGGFLVSDSGFNAVLHIDKEGTVSDYALLPDIENPERSSAAPDAVDFVPTGLSYGPDGALYVTSLTGMPFPAGAAGVYRLEDINGDGDAMDEDEVTRYAEGFTGATDLAFLEDGTLLVTEFSTGMVDLSDEFGLEDVSERPGRLTQWREGDTSVVVEGLVSPTAVAVLDGRVFVSEEFAGRVVEIGRLGR